MLEGLAVWALFIGLLRMVGMPWNKYTQCFAYVGGGSWLLFVWVGLINYTPMDISGGSVVQSPNIHLRPASSQIKGQVSKLYIQPNQEIKKGELVYEVEDEVYRIALQQARALQQVAEVALGVAKQDVLTANNNLVVAGNDVTISKQQWQAARVDRQLKNKTLQRYTEQNTRVANTVSASTLDEQTTLVTLADAQIAILDSQWQKAKVANAQAELAIDKAQLLVATKIAELAARASAVAQAQWNLDHTKVTAPADGYVTNFIMREGQFIGMLPRLQMYTNEKYVLMRVNHQAIRNVKTGQAAEFTSPVYPGKIFAAEVEGIVEATGESQGSLIARETAVTATTVQNLRNKHHFVRLKLSEPQGYDIPVGSVGLAWISAEKPIAFMNFLDVIRGIIIRMKSQIYYFYSL